MVNHARVKRVRIFVKGNVDVHDSLVYSRINGRIEWNGINTVLADAHPDYVARIRHEPCARWDAVGIECGRIPDRLAARNLQLGAHSLEAQFASRLLRDEYDILALSLQADIMNPMLRHRDEGYTFFPAGSQTWSAADNAWVSAEFTPIGLSTPSASMARLASILEIVRARSQPKVLVYTMSSVVPGERLSSYRGLGDALSTRIRAFNLALIESAADLDVHVVDVDHILASAGADRVKVDVLHLTSEGYGLIAKEVVRILENIGQLDD
jgi:hypothetical protein